MTDILTKNGEIRKKYIFLLSGIIKDIQNKEEQKIYKYQFFTDEIMFNDFKHIIEVLKIPYLKHIIEDLKNPYLKNICIELKYPKNNTFVQLVKSMEQIRPVTTYGWKEIENYLKTL